MRQPRPVMIPFGREKDLRLVLEAAECLRVNHPVAIALERRTDRVRWLWPKAPFAVATARRLRREHLIFKGFELFSDSRHETQHSIVRSAPRSSCPLSSA